MSSGTIESDASGLGANGSLVPCEFHYEQQVRLAAHIGIPVFAGVILLCAGLAIMAFMQSMVLGMAMSLVTGMLVAWFYPGVPLWWSIADVYVVDDTGIYVRRGAHQSRLILWQTVEVVRERQTIQTLEFIDVNGERILVIDFMLSDFEVFRDLVERHVCVYERRRF